MQTLYYCFEKILFHSGRYGIINLLCCIYKILNEETVNGEGLVMKTLEINILHSYKLYLKEITYRLQGDLIVLSGVNGSGKSQLLRIIAKAGKEPIQRTVTQFRDDVAVPLENILLLSFRDNINLGEDFGSFSLTYRTDYAKSAWDFYANNIKHLEGRLHSHSNTEKTQKYKDGTLIFNNNGIRNSSWRSINRFVKLLKSNYSDETVFNLSQAEVKHILPADFIWRDENDIVKQIGNLFYIACCDRANQQIAYSASTEIFNNEEWLKTAPWTILNQLFEDLNFKYRFKSDYSFNMPNMEENPKLRDCSEIRGLTDLSDGEKAILKLALVALDEEISKDIKLVLFDEYDAPLNPSLTEAFYYVIEKFYISKGTQVIITTHSPATISLAPEYTRFYEIFSQEDNSPKIIEVDPYDYSELQKANRQFYSKIHNQKERIETLEQKIQASGHRLFVEDQYDQIYKIAYLKVKGVEGLTEENYEKKFEEHAAFSVHGGFSTGGLSHQLTSANMTVDQDCVTVGLFDFDSEGYLKFKELKSKKNNQDKLFLIEDSSLERGLCLKHAQANRYALMLPIPKRLEDYVSTKTSSDCFIEIESLVSEEYLKTNSKAELRSKVLCFYKMKDNHKCDFWKDLLCVDKNHFKDFEPLFDKIEALFRSATQTT